MTALGCEAGPSATIAQGLWPPRLYGSTSLRLQTAIQSADKAWFAEWGPCSATYYGVVSGTSGQPAASSMLWPSKCHTKSL